MYRIYTEDKRRKQIERLVSASNQGFTLIPAIGYYQGKKEQSLIIEILQTTLVKAVKLAASIKRINRQSSVLVTHGQRSIFV